MYCKMDETFVLSSDSSDGGSPPAKRRSIEGVPSNFDGDRGVRFSFGVANMSTSETIPEEPIEMSTPLRSSSIAIKTPVSLRRRSVSMSSIRRRNGNAAIEPPPKELCSTFVQREIQFHDLSSEDDEANEEDVFVAGTSKKADDNLDLNMRALLSPDKKNKKKEKVEEVQNEFYGVYCLVSRSDRPCYKNRCYIGYTVDPNRRIMQHNGGMGKGGAKKTDSRGPWDMVCVIHGFPNHVAALRFEWAWQNPNVSKCIKELQLKKQRKETPLAYQIRIACELMRSKVFCRFALTFRWLITTEELPFPSTCPPPDHTKLRYGKVKKEFSLVSSKREDYMEMGECRICGKDIEKQFCNNCFQNDSKLPQLWSFVRCISVTCHSHFHSKCLAENGLKAKKEYNSHVFPLKAHCPTCGHLYLWGDVIREQRRILKVSNKCKEEFRSLVVRKDLPHREISPP